MLLLALLRQEAASERTAQLTSLSTAFAGKIATAKQRLTGTALEAAIEALKQEHSAAERELLATLAQQARQRRGEVLAALRALYREHLSAIAPARQAHRPLRTRARRRARQRRKPPRNTPPKPRR